MRQTTTGRLVGTIFLAFAASLVAYGLYGLSRFVWYTGEYFDDRLVVFDHSVYPFLWGCLFLLLGQCLRLHFRRIFMDLVAVSGLLFLMWKRTTIPAIGNAHEQLFPGAAVLDNLIVVCAAMLGLMLSDRFVQRLLDLLVVRPFSVLRHRLSRHKSTERHP